MQLLQSGAQCGSAAVRMQYMSLGPSPRFNVLPSITAHVLVQCSHISGACGAALVGGGYQPDCTAQAGELQLGRTVPAQEAAAPEAQRCAPEAPSVRSSTSGKRPAPQPRDRAFYVRQVGAGHGSMLCPQRQAAPRQRAWAGSAGKAGPSWAAASAAAVGRPLCCPLRAPQPAVVVLPVQARTVRVQAQV